jgi:hypothetical protein
VHRPLGGRTKLEPRAPLGTPAKLLPRVDLELFTGNLSAGKKCRPEGLHRIRGYTPRRGKWNIKLGTKGRQLATINYRGVRAVILPRRVRPSRRPITRLSLSSFLIPSPSLGLTAPKRMRLPSSPPARAPCAARASDNAASRARPNYSSPCIFRKRIPWLYMHECLIISRYSSGGRNY